MNSTTITYLALKWPLKQANISMYVASFTILVNWCFEPSQPLGITSRLKETFIKRYIVERTSKTEQSEKTELLGEFME